jgi:maleate isomerase
MTYLLVLRTRKTWSLKTSVLYRVISAFKNARQTRVLYQMPEKVYKVGFISPPAWFDISPAQFMTIAPPNTIVMQTVMRQSDFGYSLEEFAAAIPELKACFDSLVATGVDVVAQFGYPFSLVHGWEKARRLPEYFQEGSNAVLVMMGVEVVYALKHLGCKSIAIASTYYSDQMSIILKDYLTEAGFEVIYSGNWQSQGIAEESGSGMFIGQDDLNPMNWQTPIKAVQESVRSVARQTPGADCVLVTGGGMRLLGIVENLEKEIGKPVIGGDLALYWGILRRLGTINSVSQQGKLLANLS